MSCKINRRQIGDVIVLDISGRITLGESSNLIRQEIKTAVKTCPRILLNLSQVSYIDSGGLGELVGSYATVANSGGHMKLVNPQRRVTDLLQITKLYTIFEVHADEATALRSFQKAATA
jgi:anti-sigma B factor antagonist